MRDTPILGFNRNAGQCRLLALSGAGHREFDTIAIWVVAQMIACKCARPIFEEIFHAIVSRG
jgi:hypothetical protein